jgi:hypothetical protein
MRLSDILLPRVVKLGYTIDDHFNFESLLIKDLSSLSHLKTTLYDFDRHFSINLLTASSVVPKYKIQPIEQVKTNGGVGYKNIYSATQIFEVCAAHGLNVTLPLDKSSKILREAQLKTESSLLSAEIEAKQKKLRDIEDAINHANIRLEVAHHKLKHQEGDDLLGHEQILVMAGIKRRICGVYFLIKDCEVIYVGQSVNIHSRIDEHDRVKDFDTFTYIECEKENLSYLEARYISKFKPKLNYDSNGRLVLPLRIAA